MIRFASGGDHPGLKALWSDIFGDSREAVEEYFALRHRDDCLLVDARDDGIAGMLTMLPLRLLSSGHSFPARYIYAVATHPAYRNQGVSTRLLDHAHSVMSSRGEAAAVLVPASPGLFDFYGKRGYQTAFSLDIIRFDAGEVPLFPKDARFFPCALEAYAHFRDSAFANSRLYARWDEKAVAYAVRSLGSQGGVMRLVAQGGEGCAAWERQGGHVLVRDLPLLNMDVMTALSVLHHALKAPAYHVRLPEGSHPGSRRLPFGMINWLIPEPALSGGAPYLSLALD